MYELEIQIHEFKIRNLILELFGSNLNQHKEYVQSKFHRLIWIVISFEFVQTNEYAY